MVDLRLLIRSYKSAGVRDRMMTSIKADMLKFGPSNDRLASPPVKGSSAPGEKRFDPP